MSENNYPEQSLALLDAELIFDEADVKMRALFREFRREGYLQLTYDYVDENDEHQLVAFMSDGGIDQNKAEFIIRTADDSFSLVATRSYADSNVHKMDTKVRHLEPEIQRFIPATEKEQLKLAEVLRHLDAQVVSAETRTAIAEQKKNRKSWLGSLAARRHNRA